ncbi:MAG: threonine ammonia-lyase [Desulfobacterota bacterium]|nr:threonine ammonia-lyase [Thermodesulfobacteriota bacterium]
MELSKEIERAEEKVRKVVLRTPIIHSETLSKMTGKEVYLKLENLQKTGSFKIRGAYYKLSCLADSSRSNQVVAASAGNHAQGVAYASSLLGMHSTIVMPFGASLAKQVATKAYGGEVVLFGRDTDEALAHAREMAKAGRVLIHPFDDEEVIAGQGTIGLEILEDLPEVEGIVVPVGGGGLISGIATIVKERRPRVTVIGVQANHAPGAYRSLKRGKIIEAKVKPTLADGIAVGRIGEIAFPILQQKVDAMVLVSEEEIASAILLLMERKRIVAEGAGAATLAALLSHRARIKPRRVVLVISGGNIDLHLLDRILEKGLSRTGRMARFQVLLRDVPGALAELTGEIARHQANILHIVHERAARDIPIGFSKVILILETRGPQHIQELKRGLERKGYLLPPPG